MIIDRGRSGGALLPEVSKIFPLLLIAQLLLDKMCFLPQESEIIKSSGDGEKE